MSYEEIIIPSRDLYPLSVKIYEATNPKAIVKITHGMEEHQGRYEEFATKLVESGFTVVTADMRGHGKSAQILSHIADKNGHKLLIQDEQVLREYIENRYSGLPIYWFAHSMGTIIARNVLQKDSKKYAKVVLSGYPNYQPIAVVAIMLSAIARIFKGPKGYSSLLNNAALGPFVKAVPNAKTSLDWLSYNEKNVQNYIKDPLCGEEFTIGSFNALFHLTSSLGALGAYKNVNKELPFLLISGEDDPCTGGQKGRESSLKILLDAGFANIKVSVLEKNRHEILNEDSKDKTIKEIINFLK